MRRQPSVSRLRAVRTNCDPDPRPRQSRIHAPGEVVPPGRVVVEHVWQQDGVVVPPRIEGADGIRVVRPPFVAGNVALLRPGHSSVERLEESRQMVVRLRVDEPLADADQMARVRRIDANVGFRMVLHEQRGRLHVLGRIRTDVLPGRGARARRAAALRKTLLRRQSEQDQDLRRVTTDALRGR